MLSRYTIYRRRPKDAPPLPDGIRQDSRWRTRHILRPTQEMVDDYLANPNDEAWLRFKDEYLELLKTRQLEEPERFVELASLSSGNSVFIGCSCPTAKQPMIERCHTWLALEFIRQNYPEAKVRFPSA